MKPSVLIGSPVPAGMDYLRMHQRLKQGDYVVTGIPANRQEALAVADYCKANGLYLFTGEFFYRGGRDLRPLLEVFPTKADMDEIIDAFGERYLLRYSIGEAGGVLYWPKAYIVNRRAHEWTSLPPCKTVDQAQEAYVDYCRGWIDYDRTLGKGPLMNVDSSLAFKFHAMAGIDVLCLEAMPGDPHLMIAAIRGTGRAFDKPWGCHIAMEHYGGVCFDPLHQKRWRDAVFYSYLAGAHFIHPESGHYGYINPGRGQKFAFHTKEAKSVRAVMREVWQFARVHNRPAGGPRTTLGVVHGNFDGSPGLWNRYAWGQFHHEKWHEGPAERGWRFVDKFHRKENWPNEAVQGEEDFSGNPPYGQYDVVPIESPLEVLQQYTCLVFLAWNTMTPAIYRKLKAYVTAGGHLVMNLAHLSTHVDRAKDLKLFRNGNLADLFGVKVTGKMKKDVRGVKCMADSSLKSYRFPLWRISTDPRYMGHMTPARVKVTTGRVISGWSDFYQISAATLAAQPMIVENTVGKGKTFLVTAWEYPGDEGLSRLTEDILRVVLQGEQGDIRLLSSDRVRYAVYDGRLPGSRRKYSVVYLLNTDPDCNVSARLWVGGRTTGQFAIAPNELRLAYRCGDVVVLAGDKCIDIKSWKVAANRHTIELFSARSQRLEIHNLGDKRLTFRVNGSRGLCPPGDRTPIRLGKCVDPKRESFFAANFLVEPHVKCLDFPFFPDE